VQNFEIFKLQVEEASLIINYDHRLVILFSHWNVSMLLATLKSCEVAADAVVHQDHIQHLLK
jgi:hypothetical protein